jgi:hypothetical protein
MIAFLTRVSYQQRIITTEVTHNHALKTHGVHQRNPLSQSIAVSGEVTKEAVVLQLGNKAEKREVFRQSSNDGKGSVKLSRASTMQLEQSLQ